MLVSRRRSLPRAAWLVAALLALVGLGLSAAVSTEARAPLPQCQDNLDNDDDSKIDFPSDPGCASLTGTSEIDPANARQCSDNVDNDGDGKKDWPADPGCVSANDNNEVNPPSLPACANTLDDDGDGKRDFSPFGAFPIDPGCSWSAETSEADTQCSDGLDNDGDGRTDFPADFGCGVAVGSSTPAVNDDSEVDPPQCDDGRDNDGDGNVDHEQDPDCSSGADDSEAPLPPPPAQCADGVDNDGDGMIDLADPGCSSASDNDEADLVANPLSPSNLGTLPPPPPAAPAAPVPLVGASSRPPAARLLTPFPIVRLRGSVEGRLIRVSLLSVRAPAGSKVTVYCSGPGCPSRRVAINAGLKLVRVRSFERRLRSGTMLKIYVTKPGFFGKYTSFRFVSNRAPVRIDRCAVSPGTKPRTCPS